MSLPIAMLYTEELKATMRGRFAWLGAAVILLLLGALATLSTQGGWLQGYGIIAYCLVPLSFVPISAATMASPRANRFIECVFTAPVNRRDWLAAKFLVLLTLAGAYYAALFPSMLVYTAHVGVPFLLHRYLLWTPGILLSCIAVGSLIGVLFIGRSVIAPMGAAMGVLLAYVVFLPVQEVMAGQGEGATRIAHIALASPAVLLKNGLGFAIGSRIIPSHTRMTWISLAILVFGSLLLAVWAFLRAQGVETWEATRAQRWIILLAILTIALFPTIFADTTYDSPAPAADNAPQIRFGGRRTDSAVLVPQGVAFPRRCCSPILNWDRAALLTNRVNRRDLLFQLPIDPARAITSFHATITGDDGLEVTADPAALNQAAPQSEPHNYPNDSGPLAPDGSRLASVQIVRIPVVLTPRNPWDVWNRYPLNLAATYTVSGDAKPHSFEEHAAVDARIGGAMAQMGFAAGILPLFCLGAAVTRWRRTR